jgi:hypothetical protein|tara:strand:- start:475 stop:696 length:222 start_codon:yes stop_codon:yes gene_type:complete
LGQHVSKTKEIYIRGSIHKTEKIKTPPDYFYRFNSATILPFLGGIVTLERPCKENKHQKALTSVFLTVSISNT